MKQSNKFVRGVVILGSIVCLIFPSFMTSSVNSPIDLEFALGAVIATVLIAVLRPGLSWICAAISSLLIAVPPYPYWLSYDAQRGWYFNFFYGFSLQTVPFVTFACVFIAALALFGAIFWALSSIKSRDGIDHA